MENLTREEKISKALKEKWAKDKEYRKKMKKRWLGKYHREATKRKRKIKYKVKELEIHSDKRGWLVEMLKRNELKEDIKQVYVATIKPGCVRGNHYHLKRTEWFFLIGGEAELYFQDLKTKKRIRLKLSSKKPKVITIFPKIAHAVKNTGKETVYLVSAQNTIYNPKNPDTYEYQIIAP